MIELLGFISILIGYYYYVIFAAIIVRILIQVGVVNLSNPIVRSIRDTLDALTEPLLAPIRDRLPVFGPFDFAPLVLILIGEFIRMVLLPNIAKLVT